MIASLVVLAQRLALLTLFLREMASTRSTLMSASSAALAQRLVLLRLPLPTDLRTTHFDKVAAEHGSNLSFFI